MNGRPGDPDGDLLARHQARARGPAADVLGHEVVAVDHSRAAIELRFQARPEFCNPMGVVQGGLLMAMLDQSLVDAVMVATDMAQRVMTLEMQTQFLQPALPGALACEAKVTRAGRSTAFAEARLCDDAGNLLATATGVAALQPRET